MPKNKDRWPDLCKLVEIDDGLPTRPAGPWTKDKLWFWNRYIEITTNSMVGHPHWPAGLVYVDLFAGPGICKVRNTGERFPGSALIAAHADKKFRRILACEMDASNADALETRLSKSPAGDIVVLRGDCNQRVNELVAKIPSGALTLAFVDPEALHVAFETVSTLSKAGRVDLLILFADYMDIVRNVDRYFAQKHSNLDRMLGEASTWRKQWSELPVRAPQEICRLFADEYKLQLQTRLSYVEFREKVISAPNGPIYRLIFASKHPRGGEFWDKITKRDRTGQAELFGS